MANTALRCIVSVLALIATPALAKPNPIQAVRHAEDAYAKAVVAHDRAALEPLLARDLAYAHASGQEQDRAAYLAGALTPGGIKGITFRQRVVHAAGGIAYTHGVVIYDMGEPRAARYTAIWRRESGHWRLAVWQNTALKD
ncbi:nuclear transport factor 2 family protein [Novosphingobium terrae]|uniref:nuclear transport factor 2 family protein n=1 Tax=Novosphingobium terrae TaxID=2726189 RepID=UPI00197CDD63|nr:nuclear transport factor 2 family protein [Novosphingobium terrae]